MKRISVIVVATSVVAVALTGCGGSAESTDASGLRKGDTASSVAPVTPAGASPTTTKAGASPTTTKAGAAAASGASRTTCAEFKALDTAAEKAVIEQILAENPDSPLAGSPNVALGTAKLVCLASSNADKTVIVAAGILIGR